MLIAQPIAGVGSTILKTAESVGEFTLFALAWIRWTLREGWRPERLRLLWPQFFAIGVQSIPVVLIVGGFVGMVLSVEAFDQFKAIGFENRLGGVINISVVKQIGPVLAAVMIAGRVGGAVTAEVGTMRVTEQLDALRVMGTDPVSYLVVPRVWACLFMVPVLTIFSDIIGIFGGYAVTVLGYGVSNGDYWAFSQVFVAPWDVFNGLIKALFFGLAIGLIGCYKGFTCQPGAAGVGRAATDSFVTSFLSIIVINFFLAYLLKHVYTLLYGAATVAL